MLRLLLQFPRQVFSAQLGSGQLGSGQQAACGPGLPVVDLALLLLLIVCLTATTPIPSGASGPAENGVTLAQTRAKHADSARQPSTTKSTLPKPADIAETPPSDEGQRRSAAPQQPAAQKDTSLDQPGERKVLEFVRQHQPKLLRLLEFLESRQPALYAQALKEMARSQQRLESLASRDKDLYNVELQLWQVRSELRLLAAELAVTSPGKKTAAAKQPLPAEDHAAELVQLIEQEAAYELERLKLLRDRAQKELSRLETQIETLTTARQEQISRKVQAWQNRINKSSRR